MHDGVKVEAGASDKSFRRQETLERHLESARQVVEKMKEVDSEEVSEGWPRLGSGPCGRGRGVWRRP
jgi:hypothetical protein